ncbi:ribosome small subunit-dependent GTPase A [Cellulomonas shaoxiangyii]|uniref:Small ribosomal subunit biogenesis GTPase RsgA n=1 Tax=Cellulomonas shaoxiangyii TaxID=2566013 RepID=A0A4P7SGM2_9CELL|nr:ribosome small subunit-dependent GTPase A [Cellulomonas shaoxiangyii]QCB92647.1 ribosome small subunit-dependent GTPase A [Cellulomonas shaoxiangyii]TGY85455.1 ribosome small subunit-dependent GTPase A [Cellulomonas shaoxiangyii]
MTSAEPPARPARVTGPCRVVRADRGALLVVPADDLGAAPVRVGLDRDGLVPLDASRVPPTVGDLVEVEQPDDRTPAHVARLHPRRTALVRDSAGRTSLPQVLAANVDVVLVVEHLDPDPDLGRVERLLTLAWRSGATPVVVLTKADLVPDPAGMAADVAGVALGVDVHAVGVPTGYGLEPLRALLGPGVALVAVGPSGAGKSTLVNALAGREVMATGERRGDGRGRHTTTHRELVPLAGGAVLVDTPGIRGVGLVADADALDATFADVAALAARCRFRDCAHRAEPGCAVREALESGALDARRYDSWRRLAKEAAWQARRSDARLAAEERARWRRATREYHRDVRTRP